jgi:hypothetical protein
MKWRKGTEREERERPAGFPEIITSFQKQLALFSGFKSVLSCTQHWSHLDHLIDPIVWLRLIVSQQVCAFISSRDSCCGGLVGFIGWSMF